MTSSADNHNRIYYKFIEQKTADTFAVKDNKAFFDGQNVKVTVNALDDNHQPVARPVEYTFDANKATNDCEAIGIGGTSFSFNELLFGGFSRER